MDNKINYNNLKYVVVSSGDEYRFNKIEDPITFLDKMKNGKISLKEAKDQQQNYYTYLNTIRKGNKNSGQKKTLTNINIHFNARDNAIKFIEDCSSMIFLRRKNWQKNKKEQDLKY